MVLQVQSKKVAKGECVCACVQVSVWVRVWLWVWVCERWREREWESGRERERENWKPLFFPKQRRKLREVTFSFIIHATGLGGSLRCWCDDIGMDESPPPPRLPIHRTRCEQGHRKRSSCQKVAEDFIHFRTKPGSGFFPGITGIINFEKPVESWFILVFDISIRWEDCWELGYQVLQSSSFKCRFSFHNFQLMGRLHREVAVPVPDEKLNCFKFLT